MIYQLHTYFNSIEIKYFNKFRVTYDEWMELTEENMTWDLLLHNVEENNKYYQLYFHIQEYGLISLIMRHMAIEAFINDVEIRYVGQDRFYSELESKEGRQKSWVEKIEYVYKETTNNDFPRGGKIYSSLRDLNSVRNTLVHPKSVEFNFEEFIENVDKCDEKYFSAINKMLGNKRDKVTAQKFYIDVVKETKTLYDDLAKLFYENLKDNLR